MRVHHSIDWKGLSFIGKVLLASMVVSGAGYFSLLYATGSQANSAASPSLVLIQEMRPAPAKSLSLTLSTTTSEHIINTLTIVDAVPLSGKFIAVNLSTMVLTLYQDGVAIAKYPILAKGELGSPYETPAGFYTVLTKELDHFINGEQIDLPWSVQFYGNYFIHGWPFSADGSPVSSSYVGGDIRLSTDDAEKVYAFVDKGIGIFVYDPIRTAPATPLVLDAIPVPSISAISYLVADIDTGDAYVEQDTGKALPIGSITKLMTALVANETIPFDTHITVARSELHSVKTNTLRPKETFLAGDLLYPLLMESNDAIANRLAQTYGTAGFVDWMNATAKALDMQSTHFTNASGTSTENVSTLDDLFRLTAYLAHKKSFILNVSDTFDKELIADSGNVYHTDNTVAAKNTMLSVSSLSINGVDWRVAIIILQSKDYPADMEALTDWFTRSAKQGVDMANTVCITCALVPPYRKIQL